MRNVVETIVSADRRWLGLSLLALAAGCVDTKPTYPPLPGTLVAESAHFRLFVGAGFDLGVLPAYLHDNGGVNALEVDWADKGTMLRMPDGPRKIDYHLLTDEQITAACLENVGGCELTGTLQIATNTLPDQHELMHAYMEILAPGANPLPFLVEGAAQAIGCEDVPVGADLTGDQTSWQEVVVSGREYAYSYGGQFARYLIRTQGIDAWVQYYAQAPGGRDPAVFAANFTAFWNLSIDDVWTAMRTLGPGGATTDTVICPCSLETLPTGGHPLDSNHARHPYWVLPDTGDASLALVAPTGGAFSIADCAGIAPIFKSGRSTLQTSAPAIPSLPDAAIAFVQFPSDGRRRFVTAVVDAPIASATVGPYIADSCATTVPYPLPQDFVNGAGELSIFVDQTTVGAVSKYVQVEVPAIGLATLGSGADFCDSCGGGQGACATTAAGGASGYSQVTPGPLNVEWRVPPLVTGGFPRYFDGAAIQFRP
jgi:hypothetical protein